jgi:hypothetical protein
LGQAGEWLAERICGEDKKKSKQQWKKRKKAGDGKADP